MVLWGILILAVLAAGYVRLAPSDPAVWHVPLEFSADKDFRRGLVRIVEPGPDGLARMNKVVLETPRSKVLAGSVEAGHITYVVRSAAMGFPDYVTLQQTNNILVIYARSRFGRKDFGVNAARVTSWLNTLQM